MRQRSSFSPSRKVDFKSSYNSPSEQSSFSNLAERAKFADVRSSSKFVSSKSSFLNKNTSDTSSLTNLNSLVNSNNFKSSLSNSSNFNSNSSLPQSPTVEEPFSPRLDENRSEFKKENFKDSFKDNFKENFKEKIADFKNEFAGDAFNKPNKNIFYNNSNNNIKHVSYSISSSGSKSNNKICQINNTISNRILNRTSSQTESNSSLLGTILDPIDLQFEALQMASKNANFEDREPNESPNPIVANAYLKIGTKMTNLVEQYKDNLETNVDLKSPKHIDQEMHILNGMHYLLAKSQSIPYYGIELVNNLGKILCNLGALDHIIKNFCKLDPSQLQTPPPGVQRQTSNIAEMDEEEDELVNADENNNKVTTQLANNLSSNESLCERKDASQQLTGSPSPASSRLDKQKELKYASAKLLNNCLTKENAAHLIQNNYQNVPDLVEFCCHLARKRKSTENEQVGTGILRNLLDYNEDTCKEILIKLNAIDTILFECRTADIQTLRNCVHCLANVVLFGGEECQQKLVDRSLLIWLFPLASHRDLQIKYFALMTMVILVANKEIEGAVLKTGSLELIEPFLLSNSPQEFATFRDNVINNNGFGQSKEWLKKLVAVLDCDREQAKNLSAFHFAMESFVKKKLGQQNIFREINAISSLKKAASSPFAVASRFAAMALKSLGESVPHKLSQQVALWTINDVKEWIKQIDFSDYLENFEKSKVDGDLLLRMNECHLENDIRIKNSLLRMRFLRELKHLKKIAEYSNCDTLNIEKMLNSIGEDYVQYTYPIIQSGLDARTMPTCSLEQLKEICGITNDFHAENIINAFKNNIGGEELKGPLESIDAFISYRRVGGSQLASLLKVHLSLKGIKVFLDVEKLQAGKFHHDLLTSIKSAKNFLLVLTPHSLDRCIEDKNCDDWIHKEIVEALKNKCNIIPITYEFEWPNIEKIPEDMRPICQFNAVSWVHEFQEASVNKILRFMQHDSNPRKISQLSSPSPTPGYSLHGISQNK